MRQQEEEVQIVYHKFPGYTGYTEVLVWSENFRKFLAVYSGTQADCIRYARQELGIDHPKIKTIAHDK